MLKPRYTDLEDLDSHQYTLMNWGITAAGILFTVLRFFVRWNQHGRFFWDDALQLAAMICLIILAVLNELQHDTIFALQAIAPKEGDKAGFTFFHVITDATREQAKQQFVSIIIFWLCLWFIKASFLSFYRRLFSNLQGYMNWWWVVVVACIVTLVANILSNFLECLPLSRRFELDLQGSCPAPHGIRFVAFTTGFDILTDIMVMALPIRMLKGLHITMKEKIGVALIFSIGHVIIIFAILRVNELYISLSGADPNINVSMSMWSILEAAIAVIVGTLPSLRSLVKSKSRPTDSGAESHPYIRSGNSGTKSSRSSRLRGKTTYALQDISRHTMQAGSHESAEALARPKTTKSSGLGIRVTQDVHIHMGEPLNSRDEQSIESFIYTK